eukprot:Pgem_evm1s18263
MVAQMRDAMENDDDSTRLVASLPEPQPLLQSVDSGAMAIDESSEEEDPRGSIPYTCTNNSIAL